MHRLSIALCTLLILHLITAALRWLFLAGLLPFGQTFALALAFGGMIALFYFTTLEASPLYYLYEEQAKLYALAGLAGCVLALF